MELPMFERTFASWPQTLRQYVGVVMPMHFAWEIVQLPLYTIWSTGSVREITFAVIHCTAGDLMISSLCLVLALIMAEWTNNRFEVVALLTILFGVGYTGFSEWRNTSVTNAWTYAAMMPTVFGLGVSPLLQWMVIPGVVFWRLRQKRCQDLT